MTPNGFMGMKAVGFYLILRQHLGASWGQWRGSAWLKLGSKEESLPWGGRLLSLFVSDRGVSCLRQSNGKARKIVVA